MRVLHFVFSLLAIFLLPQAVLAAVETQDYSSPGTYRFTVPEYGTLTVTVNGAGGSGADGNAWSYGPDEYYQDAWYGADGLDGNSSSFAGVTARGGEKGYGHFGFYRNGANGTASGGNTNTTGAGGAGGAGGEYALNGTYEDGVYRYAVSGAGGSGGRATKSYTADQLAPGAVVTVVVGAGGVGGTEEQTQVTFEQPNHDESPRPVPGQGAVGQNGSVAISWTDTPPSSRPTCAITFDENPLTGNSTMMRWTSEDADLFHIRNIGYVGASGAAKISQTGNYSGTVTGPGGKATCTAVLEGSESGGKCIGSAPQHASICANDASGLSEDISRTLVPSCTVKKCEYTCDTGYTFKNGACVKDPPGTRYGCNANNQCVQSTSGEYTTSNCDRACSSQPKRYTCNQNNQCVVSANGEYTNSNCNRQCDSPPPEQRYTCNQNNQCVVNASGEYTSSNCNNACDQSPPQCPVGEVRQGGVCVCKAGLHRNPSTGQCVAECSPGTRCINNQWCTVTAICGVLSCSGTCQVGGTPSLSISVAPAILRIDDMTRVSWSSTNLLSCTVTGGNGDGPWSGRSGAQNSSPITERTVYTATCIQQDGTVYPPQSATVNLTPTFIEQ